MSNRKLFALLVGIDKYKPPIPALDGCVNDVMAVNNYLRRYTYKKGIDYHPMTILNEAATRFNLVDKFESHLGQADENDVVLFYYSGHGSQEEAHEIFWEIEPDKKSETLVCYDSRLEDGMDLADKELATLIDIVAQKNPHIVVIVDACNSGKVTRNARQESQTKVRQVDAVPRLSDGITARVRMPQSYILPRRAFSDRALSLGEGPDELFIPNSRHVNLSAARSFQLAKETHLGGQARGVFTYSLLEVLENSVGPLSYEDLMRRVRSMVAQRTYEQMPELNAPIGSDIHLEFLDGLTTLSGNYYSVQYEDGEGWTIDAGAIHGILPPNFSGEKTRLSIYAFEALEKDLNDPTKALGEAVVTLVRNGKSTIKPGGDLNLSRSKSYKARLLDLPVSPMAIYINSNGQTVKKFADLLEQSNQAKNLLELVEQEQFADYEVNDESGELAIVHATDLEQIPLAPPIAGDNEDALRDAITQLKHIAQWERIKKLGNAGSTLPSESVKIDLIDPNTQQPMRASMEGFVFEHNSRSNQFSRFKIRVRNVSGRKLFCVLLYFDAGFSIASHLLGVNGLWLESGEEAWAADGGIASALLPDELFQLGRKEVNEYLKVIFSTTEINPNLLALPALSKKVATRSTASKQRGLIFTNTGQTNIEDWNINELSFKIRREA